MNSAQYLTRSISGDEGLRKALDIREVSARSLLETALLAIKKTGRPTEGTFVRLFEADARQQAEIADERISAGEKAPLLGIPVSVKDLFDVAGYPTTAGAKAPLNPAPAARDADIVTLLKAAGAVVIGHTGMTEFAFSGLGLNPHHGTPLNPRDISTGRVPGGSSSGAAVALSGGMCALSIGSDTGGSVRIPAALCGLVGFKPTQNTVSRVGMVPLSTTLDSVGPLARNVRDIQIAYEVISGQTLTPTSPPANPRFLVPTNILLDDMDDVVAERFEHALRVLQAAGWTLRKSTLRPLEIMREMAAVGSFPAIEAWKAHQLHLDRYAEHYDPRVRSRIETGRRLSPDALERLTNLRAKFISHMTQCLNGYDGFLMPTVPTVAPTLEEVESEADYTRQNLLMLRNPTLVNLLDGCAISLPIAGQHNLPVGLTIAATGGADKHVLALATAAESILGRC